jgi:glycosyltransferase involved in cell wall biosynthesis
VRIGVITPAYNVAPYIGAAIRSVIAQSHTDWGLLVVDDGSSDGTAEIAARFADPRIRIVRQANAGVSAARNRGIAEADADALLFLDADDWLAPDAFARLAHTLDGARASAAYGAYAFVPEDAEPGARPLWVKSGPFSSGDILERLLEINLFANGGHLLIRREAIAAAGEFRRDIAFGEDWEYWIRLAIKGSFAVVPGSAPLLYVRQRRSGAYLRMATDPASFRLCMDAVFGNPALQARLGPERGAAIRRRTEAENRWIIGRELVRHGRWMEGMRWLRRSLADKPSLRRLALLGAAHALPVLPQALRGPFRPYPPV